MGLLLQSVWHNNRWVRMRMSISADYRIRIRTEKPAHSHLRMLATYRIRIVPGYRHSQSTSFSVHIGMITVTNTDFEMPKRTGTPVRASGVVLSPFAFVAPISVDHRIRTAIRTAAYRIRSDNFGQISQSHR